MQRSPRNEPARAISALPLALLGGISAEVFLRDYWQKKPLLIRNAIRNFTAPLTKREVFTLARRDNAESRLITREGAQWQLQHGPFSSRAMQLPASTLWTILIQDVQHFSHEAHALLGQFNFLPQARIDDLMVSYAVPGAGVGAHVDSYDVFLLQGMGRRRWQISTQTDLMLKPDMPLKILAHFKPTEEFVLDTGDMLYLPPSIAHHGVAETECMTWSIGFRAPSKQDFCVAYLDYLRDALRLPGHYADPNISVTHHTAEIDVGMQTRYAALLRDLPSSLGDVQSINRFIGCHLTEPKPHVVFEPPEDEWTLPAFITAAKRHGLRLDLKTRFLYDKKCLYVNGEVHLPVRGTWQALRQLADTRALPGAAFAGAPTRHTWLFARHQEGAIEVSPAA